MFKWIKNPNNGFYVQKHALSHHPRSVNKPAPPLRNNKCVQTLSPADPSRCCHLTSEGELKWMDGDIDGRPIRPASTLHRTETTTTTTTTTAATAAAATNSNTATNSTNSSTASLCSTRDSIRPTQLPQCSTTNVQGK